MQYTFVKLKRSAPIPYVTPRIVCTRTNFCTRNNTVSGIRIAPAFVSYCQINIITIQISKFDEVHGCVGIINTRNRQLSRTVDLNLIGSFRCSLSYSQIHFLTLVGENRSITIGRTLIIKVSYQICCRINRRRVRCCGCYFNSALCPVHEFIACSRSSHTSYGSTCIDICGCSTVNGCSTPFIVIYRYRNVLLSGTNSAIRVLESKI